MKTLEVFYKDALTGYLSREEDGTFRFQYAAEYLQSENPAISIHLRKQAEAFEANRLFAFFDGIIPEGWLLKVATDKLRLNPLLDRFELLEQLCHDTIGAVSVGSREAVKIDHPHDVSATVPAVDRCMICYDSLDEGEVVYHPACMNRVFQGPITPLVSLDESLLQSLANQQINKKLAVTGAQKKISLGLDGDGKATRLTMTDMWGHFIFKPGGPAPHLPANEHLCMLLANTAGIQVADTALIPVSDGTMGFVSRRFDRGAEGEKFHQEDFCQILGKDSYEKYNGSVEQIGKALKQHSDLPGDNLYRLVELTVFNFLIGNVDAHLKNFSLLYETPKGANRLLSPAYDLLSTDLYLVDDEESALAINGRKNNLKRKDFLTLAAHLGVNDKVFGGIVRRFEDVQPVWAELIEVSFLEKKKKRELIGLVGERLGILN